jgi:hypothetical protein
MIIKKKKNETQLSAFVREFLRQNLHETENKFHKQIVDYFFLDVDVDEKHLDNIPFVGARCLSIILCEENEYIFEYMIKTIFDEIVVCRCTNLIIHNKLRNLCFDDFYDKIATDKLVFSPCTNPTIELAEDEEYVYIDAIIDNFYFDNLIKLFPISLTLRSDLLKDRIIMVDENFNTNHFNRYKKIEKWKLPHLIEDSEEIIDE